MCKSFVFYEDWLLAAETIDDPVLRGEFLQTIATFALRGEGAECSPELRIALSMVKGQIVRDKEKYNEKVEKRRVAARASHTVSKSANAACAAVNHTGNATVIGTVNADNNAVTITDNTFPPPGRGAKEYVDFSIYLRQIADIHVPEAVSKANYDSQYIWRVLDYGDKYAKNVTELTQRKLTTDNFANAMQSLNELFKPHTDFQIIRLGRAISKMNPEYRKAFLAEYHRSMLEPDIIGILLEKAEYIHRGNGVTSIYGFLKTRR